MNPAYRRLAYQRQVAAHWQRRKQLALLIEQIDRLQATPARGPEQERLKREAVSELVAELR